MNRYFKSGITALLLLALTVVSTSGRAEALQGDKLEKMKAVTEHEAEAFIARHRIVTPDAQLAISLYEIDVEGMRPGPATASGYLGYAEIPQKGFLEVALDLDLKVIHTVPAAPWRLLQSQPSRPGDEFVPYVPGRIYIKLKPSAAFDDIIAVLSKWDSMPKDLTHMRWNDRVKSFYWDSESNVFRELERMAELKALPFVQAVELDGYRHLIIPEEKETVRRLYP